MCTLACEHAGPGRRRARKWSEQMNPASDETKQHTKTNANKRLVHVFGLQNIHIKANKIGRGMTN